MSDEATKPQTSAQTDTLKTDPADGADAAWPDEAKILPDPYLEKPAANTTS